MFNRPTPVQFATIEAKLAAQAGDHAKVSFLFDCYGADSLEIANTYAAKGYFVNAGTAIALFHGLRNPRLQKAIAEHVDKREIAVPYPLPLVALQPILEQMMITNPVSGWPGIIAPGLRALFGSSKPVPPARTASSQTLDALRKATPTSPEVPRRAKL